MRPIALHRRLAPILAVTATAVFSTAAAPLEAQEWREFRASRLAGDYESLAVELVYGAGGLTITGADQNILYDVLLRYDGARFAPSRSWVTEDGRGRLRVTLRSDGAEGSDFELDDLDLDLDLSDLEHLDDSSGRLNVKLGRSVPTDLSIKVGAAENRFSFGGVPLTSLRLTTGASDTQMSFDQPNPVDMRELVIEAGAAHLEAEELGNAGFERMEFKGGIGDVVLDFDGEWRRSAELSLKMGLGGLKLRIPERLGVRINRKSFLSSFDAPGFQKIDGAHQTSNWETADLRLSIDLDAAFGTVTIERLP